MSNSPLSASYTSPSNPPFSISLPVSSTSTDDTANQPNPTPEPFLSSLRAAIASAQETINQELTSRMEEDKVAAAAHFSPGAKTAVDEDKEEQNYGEEVQEEEEEL